MFVPCESPTGRVATTIQELLGKAASGEAAGAGDGRGQQPAAWREDPKRRKASLIVIPACLVPRLNGSSSGNAIKHQISPKKH